MEFGWTGRILDVNLSRGTVSEETLTSELKEGFIGGRGINSKIAYDKIKLGIDPLSPENVLIFGVGPLGGTLAPACGRWTVTAKSPLTGILGDANSGGHWGPELKFAGFDHVVFYGRSPRPVYLWVNDGHAEIKDASHLWGKNTWETTEAIAKDLAEPEVKVACIGPAGENLVYFACVMSDRSRAAGRTGMGAVMGSKNLKAIAVRGTQPIQVAHPEDFEKAAIKAHEIIRAWPAYQGLAAQGTPLLTTVFAVPLGWWPVRNWQSGYFPEADAISGDELVKKYSVKSVGCFGCPIHCSHFYVIREGPYAGTLGEGAEYETISAVGGRCGNADLASILYMNNLLNQYGLDSISTGNTIALAMELYQRGLITEKDTDGLDLSWGNKESMIALIHKIAKKEGFGGILAEGALKAAIRIGKGAERYVLHSKGLDEIGVDLRSLKGAALGHATSTRGADHLRGMCAPEEIGLPPDVGKALFGIPKAGDGLAYEDKPRLVVFLENITAAIASASLCLFNTIWICISVGPKEIGDMLSSATGIPFDEKRLMTCGERIFNIERAFLVREGISRKDDTIGRRFLEEPLPDGARKGEIVDLEKFGHMLDEYYKLREWDKETGIPTRAKLEALGLRYVANDLEKLPKPPKPEKKA